MFGKTQINLAFRSLIRNFVAEISKTAYSMEEINSRIDESEAQMIAGEVLSGEEVHDKMRQYIIWKAEMLLSCFIFVTLQQVYGRI